MEVIDQERDAITTEPSGPEQQPIGDDLIHKIEELLLLCPNHLLNWFRMDRIPQLMRERSGTYSRTRRG